MTLTTWWAFVITTALICAAPGPNMLNVMSSSINHGFRRSFVTMSGCFVAVFVTITTSVLGLGALLHASPLAFNILRYAGAAYLIYVGIKSWRSSDAIIDSEISIKTQNKIPKKEIFWKGFFVGISNPKSFLFATAFFPQFIDPEKPEAFQFLILVATFTVLEFSCYMTYALGGTTISKILKNPKNQRCFNKLIGALFGGFGVLLLFYKLN